MHEGYHEEAPHDPKPLKYEDPAHPEAGDPELPEFGLPENSPLDVPDKTETPFDKPLPEIGDVSNKDGVPAEKNPDDYRDTE